MYSISPCILKSCPPSRALQRTSASLSQPTPAEPLVPHLHRHSMPTVPKYSPDAAGAWEIATRWCRAKGEGWSPLGQLGRGGTAPVFEIQSPLGLRALKIYDEKFSSGKMGEIEHSRIQQQLELRDHDCPSLVHVYEGGMTDDRLYLLMSRASGTELEERLPDIPRSKIRTILHDVAQACLFLESRGLCHRDVKTANVFVSDDFSNATLLDISVIRAIHDPVGVGSDHDGQLPVLATARYSPPEYLFRLLKPGPDLWHALNVYQLGAVLHDLIVRIPLFQDEYERSKSNRYRFAWVVATQDPRIEAHDIDHDLLFLARRALDKDWRRRSSLNIEDFFNDSTTRQQHAFHLLGVHRDPVVQAIPNVQDTRVQLDRISRTLDTHLTSYFRNGGVTPTHRVFPGPDGDNSRTVELTWTTNDALGSTIGVSFQCTLRLVQTDHGKRFALTVALVKQQDGTTTSVDINLPDVPDDDRSSTELADQAEAAFCKLATELLSAEATKP